MRKFSVYIGRGMAQVCLGQFDAESEEQAGAKAVDWFMTQYADKRTLIAVPEEDVPALQLPLPPGWHMSDRFAVVERRA